MQELPGWAQKVLGGTGVDRIEAAIAAAESKTSGEIVPVLVRRSSTVGHVPLLAFCLALILALAAEAPMRLSELLGGPHLLWIALTWGLAALLGMAVARFDTIQRLLTPKLDQLRQVDVRAELEFFELGLDKTQGHTGVLLFVSLMERRAVVLADKAIAAQLDAETWKEVVALMIDGVKRNDLAAGQAQAVERCGELLAPGFPIRPDDTNELRDSLIVKE